ncbi:MAG: DUF58 domain-containing protein [Planctomycetota bacterium]
MTRRRRNEAPPAASPPFDAAFRALLPALLGQTAQFRGARDQAQRARRAVLSQSGTFVGHRPYARGDDLRRLDWAAYARTGALFTKQLEEEERRTAAVLLDLSASLLVGAVPRRLAMLRLAAVVGGLALAHLDGLVVVAPGAGPLALANFTGIGQLAALLQHLEALPVATAGPEQAVELLLRRGLPGRVHWLGDFAVPAAHELPLAALRRRGVRVTAWLPTLPADREPPRGGFLRFVDPETQREVQVPVDGPFATALAHELELLARQQDQLFAQAGAPLVRWPVTIATSEQAAAWTPVLAELAR